MSVPWTVSSSSRGGSQSQDNASTGSAFHHTNNKRFKALIDLKSSSRKIQCGRFLFVFVLLVAAAVLGYGAYSLMDTAQMKMASDRFDSISERALSLAQYVVEEKKRATDALALMVGSAHPNASIGWPMVALDGYTQIATSLRIITAGSLCFCPIVNPGGEEQRQFEEYAYDLFRRMGYASDTGESDFGRGIFSYGNGEHGNETWQDGRFHITSGWTYHNSSRNVLVPFLQSDYGPHPSLMLNFHAEVRSAVAIDRIMACSEQRALAGDYRECGSMTDLMWSAKEAEDIADGPTGLIMVPIYPRLDNTTLTGFIVAKQIWSDLLRYSFELSVSGVNVILYTKNFAHTYLVTAGKLEYVGPGWVHHDPNAQFQVKGAKINQRYFSNNTIEYFMDVYSTDEFLKSSINFGSDEMANIPVVACASAVGIMLLTSLLFVLYDYWVRKEFDSKKRLLDAKRQFVRFISHEVRTPLNTICMGLNLLQHDLEVVLGLEPKRNRRISISEEKEECTRENDECAQSVVKETLHVQRDRIEEWMTLSDQVSKNAESAISVLSDLLNYDKIQMKTLVLELTAVNLWRLLENDVKEFNLTAREKNVSLALDFTPLQDLDLDRSFHSVSIFKRNAVEPPAFPTGIMTMDDLPTDVRFCKLIADSVRIHQVFRNLLSNALKFTKKTVVVRVSMKVVSKRRQKEETVEVQKDEFVKVIRVGNVVVQVIDDGVGMTNEQVKHVFDDGTQFNANALQAGGGSGLGLSIARGLVIQHGGDLSCSSDGLGKGTTFTVTLPIYEEIGSVFIDNDESMNVEVGDHSTIVQESLKIKQILPSFPEEGDECDIPAMRLLVVDDSTTNRKLCMRILERVGHTTEGACDGKEALEMVRKSLDTGNLYDCILLDYEMPILSGPKACELMRRIGCSSFIVGVTGNVMSEDVNHFRSCGADWVLPKPFRLESLEQQWIQNGMVRRSKTDSDETGESKLMVDMAVE